MLMKNSRMRLVSRGALGAVTMGMAFEVGSCAIDDAGAISGFADPMALAGLATELFETLPFSDMFDAFVDNMDERFDRRDSQG